jgi:hypothetical protein
MTKKKEEKLGWTSVAESVVIKSLRCATTLTMSLRDFPPEVLSEILSRLGPWHQARLAKTGDAVIWKSLANCTRHFEFYETTKSWWDFAKENHVENPVVTSLVEQLLVGRATRVTIGDHLMQACLCNRLVMPRLVSLKVRRPGEMRKSLMDELPYKSGLPLVDLATSVPCLTELDMDVGDFSFAVSLPATLESLCFRHNRATFEYGQLHLGHLKSLTSLKITSDRLESCALEYAVLPKSLTGLAIDVTDRDVEFIDRIPASVQSLHLVNKCHVLDTACLAHVTSLTELVVEDFTLDTYKTHVSTVPSSLTRLEMETLHLPALSSPLDVLSQIPTALDLAFSSFHPFPTRNEMIRWLKSGVRLPSLMLPHLYALVIEMLEHYERTLDTDLSEAVSAALKRAGGGDYGWERARYHRRILDCGSSNITLGIVREMLSDAKMSRDAVMSIMSSKYMFFGGIHLDTGDDNMARSVYSAVELGSCRYLVLTNKVTHATPIPDAAAIKLFALSTNEFDAVGLDVVLATKFPSMTSLKLYASWHNTQSWASMAKIVYKHRANFPCLEKIVFGRTTKEFGTMPVRLDEIDLLMRSIHFYPCGSRSEFRFRVEPPPASPLPLVQQK